MFFLEIVPQKEETLHEEKVPAQSNFDDITSSMVEMAYNPSLVPMDWEED